MCPFYLIHRLCRRVTQIPPATQASCALPSCSDVSTGGLAWKFAPSGEFIVSSNVRHAEHLAKPYVGLPYLFRYLVALASLSVSTFSPSCPPRLEEIHTSSMYPMLQPPSWYVPYDGRRFTAEGTANKLVISFIPLRGFPSTMMSDNWPQFCAQLSSAVYRSLGTTKLSTSARHPSGNGGLERANHILTQMLTMVCNGQQDDWDIHPG